MQLEGKQPRRLTPPKAKEPLQIVGAGADRRFVKTGVALKMVAPLAQLQVFKEFKL